MGAEGRKGDIYKAENGQIVNDAGRERSSRSHAERDAAVVNP